MNMAWGFFEHVHSAGVLPWRLNRVMYDGPWTFRKLGVLIESDDGIVDPSSVVLDISMYGSLHVKQKILPQERIKSRSNLWKSQDIIYEIAATR
jgi:hypothetical protein